ncbi:ubiquitin-conjugating enzyme E2-17 kDa-like [Thrips palmi]|uniref:Ubiquitin-conjugating enzyme E2-17 kDa-like n=1 Tax=Thrips palmi TaxID=161013 RepID=A0A6P8YIG6_THRPL|nr:ubiquitin-conjugating enzyme E2-17 kDa-like [Thrips palmi]
MDHPNIVLRDVAALAACEDFELRDATNLKKIVVAIPGSVGTPYETGVFEVELHIPRKYPYESPKFLFKTIIFHPNIGPEGVVCVDMLDDKWYPSYTLETACLCMQTLMRDPNPMSPLNVEAGRMMRRDQEMFERTVVMWTKIFAKGTHSYPDYEEKLSIISALNGDIAEALRALTSHSWDQHEASQRVTIIDPEDCSSAVVCMEFFTVPGELQTKLDS